MSPHKQQRRRKEQEQEQSEVSNRCDESKCVSRGLSKLSNNSFTCYGDDQLYPMMCADGYQPRVVENESPMWDANSPSIYSLDGSGVLARYFTCCPPDLSAETKVTRHCSNPIVTNFSDFAAEGRADDNNNITVTCNDDTRQYSRRMKTKKDHDELEIESHMCCDSIIVNGQNTTDFLDDTECVPYRNNLYVESKVRNKYGMISAITCEFIDGEFQFPRLVEIRDSLSIGYKCCKTGPASPPFVQDSVFNLTIYPQIALSSIAVASSIIMILGLSIPLLMQLKKGRSHRSSRRSSRKAKESEISRGSEGLTLPRGSPSLRRSRIIEANYSSYNLYLVYLAIPDLLTNLYLLGMYGSYANQKFNPEHCGFTIGEGSECIVSDRDDELIASMVSGVLTANFYLNAVVAYEVLTLLRNSRQVRRSNPPSILKVTSQAAAVFFFAILVSITYYFTCSAAMKAENNGDYERSSNLDLVRIIMLNVVVLCLLPIGFFTSVCITIWRHGLMPSISGTSLREKALRELAWYFFRIIAVFGACWIPMTIINSVGGTWKFSVSHLTLAMQQILSTCMAMTKSDVRKHIIDLLTLSHVRAKSQKLRGTPTEELQILSDSI